MAPTHISATTHLTPRQSYGYPSDPSLSTGAILGIVIAVISILLVIVAVIIRARKSERSYTQPQPQTAPSQNTSEGLALYQSYVNNTMNNQNARTRNSQNDRPGQPIELVPSGPCPTRPYLTGTPNETPPPSYLSVAAGNQNAGRYISGHRSVRSGAATAAVIDAGATAASASAASSAAAASAAASGSTGGGAGGGGGF